MLEFFTGLAVIFIMLATTGGCGASVHPPGNGKPKRKN